MLCPPVSSNPDSWLQFGTLLCAACSFACTSVTTARGAGVQEKTVGPPVLKDHALLDIRVETTEPQIFQPCCGGLLEVGCSTICVEEAEQHGHLCVVRVSKSNVTHKCCNLASGRTRKPSSTRLPAVPSALYSATPAAYAFMMTSTRLGSWSSCCVAASVLTNCRTVTAQNMDCA